MEAKSIDRKSLQLSANGESLGDLVYESLFSLKAEISLLNARYEIKPAGYFGTSLTVRRDEAEIASLVMNWRGHIVFKFQDGQEYVLKANGIFNSKFVIENKDGEKLVQFDPKFNWSKFDYNYDITYDGDQPDTLLILLGVYASNFYIASMSGAVSGVA